MLFPTSLTLTILTLLGSSTAAPLQEQPGVAKRFCNHGDCYTNPPWKRDASPAPLPDGWERRFCTHDGECYTNPPWKRELELEERYCNHGDCYTNPPWKRDAAPQTLPHGWEKRFCSHDGECYTNPPWKKELELEERYCNHGDCYTNPPWKREA